jgi:spermidine/putrescine transport system ATP-binding protein
VDVVIRPEDIQVTAPEQGMLSGKVTGSTFKGVHYEVIVDINGFKWMIQTTACISEGDHIGMIIGPEDIHIMEKSQYSGMFGDYSSFSDEMDYISDPAFDLSEEGESAEGGEDRVD